MKSNSNSFSTLIIFILLTISGFALIRFLNIKLNPNVKSSLVTLNYYPLSDHWFSNISYLL